MNLTKAAFLFFMITIVLTAQQNEFPKLTEAEVDYGKITREEFYDGESLWGLIDGGADVYLEYGLDRMLFQEVKAPDNTYRVEIYAMRDEEAAFGIYSINKYNCNKTDTLTNYICITPYQVQAAVGRYYISIANEDGKPKSNKYTVHLFDLLLKQIDYRTYVLPEYFRQTHFAPYWDKIKVVKGKLGLQNGFVKWEKLFDNYENYSAAIMPVNLPNGYANIAGVKFNSEKDAEKFLKENTEIKPGRTFEKIKSLSPQEIIFIESNLSPETLNTILLK